MSQLHKCGQCGREFESVTLYADHVCKSTGFQPTDPQHQGEIFAQQVSVTARERGELRKEEEGG